MDGEYSTAPWWRPADLAKLMAAHHWIEPASSHNRTAPGNRRILTPPFTLPAVGVEWGDGITAAERTDDSRRLIWQACQQALQDAYKNGVVGDLFCGAGGVWHTIGTHINRHVYIIKDLGEMEPAAGSVIYINDKDAKLPDDVMLAGIKETPDPEEHLYMDAVPPRASNGYH
ncbi:hypothetical protein H2200_004431 [Cladophialophora chaetospira]|uniref:Uncharacterized protein n=1 Tax=Cladophialophora chaetospira TaxID=386627 RepID=A0AA38XD40_9EURO|nr:hypothetical protein H2200_004431 [Cladophialophora chaetospira]